MNKINDNNLIFAFILFKAMQKDNLSYIYRGRFTQNITDHILFLAEDNLEKEEQSSKIKKRVYSIMVECLQNVTRHQNDTQDNSIDNFGLFVIQKKDEKYFITTGNLVEKSSINNIRVLIEKINSLEKEELKNYYKEVLDAGSLSNKGGAGLGLIDMARKSGNKLSYIFKDISDDFSYFYLHTIPTLETVSEVLDNNFDDSLNNIIDIHKIINEENILIIFNGFFNQESFINLLGTLDGQENISSTEKKETFFLAVDSLQNIVKLSEERCDDTDVIPGIIIISVKENQYYITFGNFVCSGNIHRVKKKLECANNLTSEQLIDNNVFNENDKLGKAIMDLRVKSENPIVYNFFNVEDDNYFFLIQTVVHIS
jgi:uncharacterized protein YjfI (DUF2170 family)